MVDDHPVMATAVSTAISAMRMFARIETAGNFDEAMSVLAERVDCRLVILDLHLGESSARQNLQTMRERFPDVPVLVFSGDESLESISMAFECFARGYVPKSSPMPVLKSAIQLIASGGFYVPPQAISILTPDQPASWSTATDEIRISERQRQVLELLLQGMPNKVIGSRLDMAEGTVKAHLNTVFRVLGVRNRVEAILRARDLGLV